MLKKVIHVFFAFIVLLGSTGYTLHTHYCGEEQQSSHVFDKVSSCCPVDEEGLNDCCRNESELRKLNDDYLGSNILKVYTDFDLIMNIPNPSVQLPEVNHFLIDYLNYKPPLLALNITIEFQSFLC